MQKKLLAVVLAGVLGLSACSDEAHTVQSTEAKSVATHVVKTQSVAAVTQVPGSVVSDQQAKMASRLMGYIRDFEVNVGDRVKRGDLLFSIDPVDLDSASSQAAAAVAQARAAMRDAKADYERFKALYAEGSVPKQQLDKMKLQFQVAEQNLKKAEAGLKQASGQMEYADVRAPFDGIVVQKMAVAGDLAAPGHPVVILENQKDMFAQVNVSGDLYARLKKGDAVMVEVDGRSAPVAGVVERIVSAANPMTRSHLVKVKLADEQVNSGTFLRVNFPAGDKQVLMVPSTAVMTRAGVTGVMVVGADNRLNFRMVRLGQVTGAQTEILAGILSGERIVTQPTDDLMTGDLVN